MKRFIPSLVLSTLLVGTAVAQSLAPDRSVGESLTEYLTHEFTLRQLADLPTREAAQRRDAQYREKWFGEKTNRCVRAWRQLPREYNHKNTFNIKTTHHT